MTKKQSKIERRTCHHVGLVAGVAGDKLGLEAFGQLDTLHCGSVLAGNVVRFRRRGFEISDAREAFSVSLESGFYEHAEIGGMHAGKEQQHGNYEEDHS